MSPAYFRELTRSERVSIRRLVTKFCANYDEREKLCLPLDCPCYMLQNGGLVLCAVIFPIRYFQ